MKKRMLTMLLTLALVVCVLPMAASAANLLPNWCVASGGHFWENGDGICVECETICTHANYDEGFCSECGVKCAHASYEDGKCAYCGIPCEHETIVDGACPVCGEACTHENWRYEAAVPATCKAPGLTYGKVCVDCDYVFFGRQEIAALAHTKATVPGYAATCTKEGRTDGVKCSACNQTLKSQRVIPALDHDYVEEPVETVLAPTCTDRGIVRRKCSRCEETKKFNVSALGHVEEAYDVPASCVAAAKKDGIKCTREGCGAILKEPTAYGNGLGHDYSVLVETVAEVTCTADGEEIYKCSRCDATENRTVTKLGHDKTDLMEILEEPTCEGAGKGKFGCTRCNVWSLLPIEKLGHNMEEYRVKEATCTTVGHIFRACSRCELVETERVQPLGHTDEIVPAVEATCTSTGLTEGTKCSVCDEIQVAQTVVAKLPHAWEDVAAQDATCTTDGYSAHRQCANCPETDGKEVIAASAEFHEFENFKCTICQAYDSDHEHDGTEVSSQAATCTADGSKTFRCSGCGYEWTEVIAAKGHNYVGGKCSNCEECTHANRIQTGYRAPTCTVQGMVTKKCTSCGDVEQTLIEMLGHSYSNGTCSRCGGTVPGTECLHPEESCYVHEQDATCTENGYRTKVCNECHKAVSSQTLVANGHNYVNGTCSECGKINLTGNHGLTYDFQDVFLTE